MKQLKPFILCLSIILLSQPLMAADAKPALTSRNSSSWEEYQYQQALYFFLVGDYLLSSRLTGDIINSTQKENDKAILLKRLSDLRILYTKGNYPPLSSKPTSKNAPSLVNLFDTFFAMGEHEKSLALSKDAGDDGAVYYFKGINLIRLNRLKEADLSLAMVPADDRFYPYARIALAQIGVMRQNLKDAEKELRIVLSRPGLDQELLHRTHLLLGQVLFEQGSFREATKEFSQVPPYSPRYKEALINHAWALVKLEEHKKVISLVKDLDPELSYDTGTFEGQMILGYSYRKSGMKQEAQALYQQLLQQINEISEKMHLTISDKSLRQRFISNLLQNKSAPLAHEEERLLSALQNDTHISSLLKEYEALGILKQGFLTVERQIEEQKVYGENAIIDLTGRQKKMNELIARIKNSLMYMVLRYYELDRSEKVFRSDKGISIEVAKITGFLYPYWKTLLGRELSEEAKIITKLILHEGIKQRDRECLERSVVCHILNPVKKGKVQESPAEIRAMLESLEKVGSEVLAVQHQGKNRFEPVVAELNKQIDMKIKENKRMLSRLEEAKKRAQTNLQECERGLELSIAGLDAYLVRKFVKMSHDIESSQDHTARELVNVTKDVVKQ